MAEPPGHTWLTMPGLPLSALVRLALAVLTLAVGEEWPNHPDTRLTMLALPLSALVGLVLAVLVLARLAHAVLALSGVTPTGVAVRGLALAMLVLAGGAEWPNSPNA
jgi:hypothetical protein